MNKFMESLFIDKKEYEEFLYAIKHYAITGMDVHTALEMYIETAEPSTYFKKKLESIKRTIEKKGADLYPDLLLEEGILLNRNELVLFKRSANKEEGINIIIQNRQKNQNITSKYSANYMYHMLSALMLMSWYLAEGMYVETITSAGSFFNMGTKEGIYLQPVYWIPFQTFIGSSVYFLWAAYAYVVLFIGKHISLRYYYKIQKHQETNDLIHFFKLLVAQTNLGNNLYDSIKNIEDAVDRKMVRILKLVKKDLEKGKRRVGTIFENNGFSKEASSIIKLLDRGGNYQEIIHEIIAVLEGRREKIKNVVEKKEAGNAKFSFIVSNIGLGLIIAFEAYRAILGINLK